MGGDDGHRTLLPDGVLSTSDRVTLSIAALDINRDGAMGLVTLSTANVHTRRVII